MYEILLNFTKLESTIDLILGMREESREIVNTTFLGWDVSTMITGYKVLQFDII